jgi:uncharacterized protein (DUF1499 family)
MLMLGGTRPVGLVDGRLRPCPGSPNCVCSQAADAAHTIAPLQYSDDPSVAWKRLREVVGGLPRVHVVAEDEHYLHAEFTSALLRFVDDVEFLLDVPDRVIHVRSASRVGCSDLGANRKRIEGIRKIFEADLQSAPSTGQAVPPAGSPPKTP